jgi:hypothetical protein
LRCVLPQRRALQTVLNRKWLSGWSAKSVARVVKKDVDAGHKARHDGLEQS